MKKPLLAFAALILALAMVCTALSSARAADTILWSGGEDDDFTCVGGCYGAFPGNGYNVGLTYYTGFARESISSYESCSTATPPAFYYQSPAFTPQTSFWIHAVQYVANANLCSGGPADLLDVQDANGVVRIAVRAVNNNAGQYYIYSRNTAGTQTLLASNPSNCGASNNLITMDLYVNYSTSGQVTLYCNGSVYETYSGDVTAGSGLTQLSEFLLANPSNNGSWLNYWSEVIVATSNTTAMRLVTLAAAANGSTDTFEIGGVTNVNETYLNKSNNNATGFAGRQQLYTVSAFPSGNFSVNDLSLNIFSLVSTTGPQHLLASVQTGGTIYQDPAGDLAPLQNQWGLVRGSFPTNPNTGVPWLTTDLSAVGFNTGFASDN